jgi:hypothetical protein
LIQYPRDVRLVVGRWRFLLWLVVGMMLCFIGWQMVGIVAGDEVLSKDDGKVEGMPTKYHTDRDVFSKRVRGEGDPIGSYVERARRGMTEREVVRLMDEFDEIGFMPSSGDVEESRQYAEKLNDWYAQAVEYGLSLDTDQRLQLRVSLRDALDQRIESYRKGKDAGKSSGIFIEMSFEAQHVYRSASMAPWKLIDLNEDQMKLTTKKLWEEKQVKRLDVADMEGHEFAWLEYFSLTMQDPVTGESERYPPPSALDLICQMPGTIKGGILDISDAFPLTPDQELAGYRLDLVAQAKMLHPSQFRMALLLNPHLSQMIRGALAGDL